jgi:transcription initiation factor TFIIIB Brf1 subunit/transcription initiation factor TFIIB
LGGNLKAELVRERITLITKKLSLDEDTEKKVCTYATELATKYLKKLSENEERSALDVALSAVYLSCLKLDIKLSQTKLASSIFNGLNRWPCVVTDMSRKL